MIAPGANQALNKHKTLVHNLAYARWANKLRDGVQVGQNIAERRQTIEMIRSAISALRSPLEAILRAKRSGALKTASNVYLANHFGLQPLMDDIYKLLQLLESQASKGRVVTAQKTLPIKLVLYNFDGFTQEFHGKVTVRHSAFAQLVDPKVATLAQLNLLNPASIAWEVTPFSFVIDWLFPIGTYLASLDDKIGYSLSDAYTTTLVRGKFLERCGAPSTPSTYVGFNTWQGLEAFCIERAVGTVVPVWQSTLNPWSTSITRTLTSLSLLVQRFPKLAFF